MLIHLGTLALFWQCASTTEFVGTIPPYLTFVPERYIIRCIVITLDVVIYLYLMVVID